MSDRLNTIAKERQNLDSTFKVSPFQSRGFEVQQKAEESAPATKAELWENYQQAKQLNQKGANISASVLPIQAKLTIGQPGDKYEQEADSMAAQVMQMPEPGLATSNITNSVQARSSIEPIQRVCSECQEETKEESKQEEEGEQIQTKGEQGQPPELRSIQRKVNSGDDVQSGSNLENQLNGSKGGGSPLTDDVRGFMEPRFGADFSAVRVHTGSDAVQMNSQLNAQAFANGSDIYFGAGKAPAKDALTAHELTHVVQQTGDAVSPKVIQCYQAGDSGHGSIEKKGLLLAGFTAEQAEEAYLGNWMRDLSQLGPDLFPLVELLGMGEFGKQIDPGKLGTYVPSEHMDNPDGGNTVEDQTTSTNEKDVKARDENKSQLSESQKKDQEAANAAYADIKAAAAKNRLPAYIERSKFMAKRKLVEAIGKGETPEGREEMSSALHAIEDYFSHTNFTEAAIWVLAKDNPAKYKSLMAKMSKTTLGTGAATVGGIDPVTGMPQIISGTYVAGANNMVSKIELLKTELESGALTVALVKGLMMKEGIMANDLAHKLGEKTGVKPILQTVEGGVGAVVGGVEGAIEGASRGAKTGGSIGSKVGGLLGSFGAAVGEEIGEIVGGGVGVVTGGISGAREGEATGEAMGEQDAESIIKAAGFVIQGGMIVITAATVARLLTLFPLISLRLAAVVAFAKSKLGQKLLDAYAEKKVADSAQEAKAKGLTGPTHSELAKDAPEHPLFDASSALAVKAVEGIGSAMKVAWSQNKDTPSSAVPIGVDAVTSQVDKYVCSLDGNLWWKDIIESQATNAGITTPNE
jgi:Domain of unknown function (DUF4157)/Heterokaryon incompatibility protein Het-C